MTKRVRILGAFIALSFLLMSLGGCVAMPMFTTADYRKPGEPILPQGYKGWPHDRHHHDSDHGMHHERDGDHHDEDGKHHGADRDEHH